LCFNPRSNAGVFYFMPTTRFPPRGVDILLRMDGAIVIHMRNNIGEGRTGKKNSLVPILC